MARLRLCTVLTITIASAFATAAQGPGLKRSQILSAYKEAVVLVESTGTMYNAETRTEQGSGFFISSDGLLLTSNHLLFPKHNFRHVTTAVRIGSASAKPVRAVVVATDLTNDLALLQVSATNLSAVRLGDSRVIQAGDDVTVLSFPWKQPEVHINRGIVSAQPPRNPTVPTRWHSDVAVAPGSSGGPVFDEQGQVVAVVWGGFTIPVGGVNIPVGISEFVPIELFYMGIGQKAASGAFAAASTLPPLPPPREPLKISRADSIVMQAEPVVDGPRPYEWRFDAEPGYRITAASVLDSGSAHMTGLTAEVIANGAAALMRATVSSHATARGYLNATLVTEQQFIGDRRVSHLEPFRLGGSSWARNVFRTSPPAHWHFSGR